MGASFILGIFEIIGDIFNDMRRGFLSAFHLLFKIEIVFSTSPPFFELRHTEDRWKSIIAISKRKPIGISK